jgi:TRAP-type transport system periplasmic protein
MQKKKIKLVLSSLVLILALVSLLLVSACSSSPSQAPSASSKATAPAPASSAAQPPAAGGKAIVLNAVGSFASNSASMACIPKIADAVNQKSNGQLQIKYIGGPEAIAAADQPAALKNRMVDMLASPTDYYQNLQPLMAAAPLCQYTVDEQAKNGLNDYWNEIYSKGVNARFLGWAGYSQFFVFLTKEVKNPKTDFKGLKVRTSPVYLPFLKALGAVPVTIAANETYSALQTGIVEGAGWVPDQIYSNKAYELLKYYIDAPFYATCLAVMVNSDSFNALPKNLQDILTTTSTEILNKQVKDMNVTEDDYMAQFIKGGMRTITLSADDKAWFIKTAYESKWADLKTTFSPADYDKAYKLLNKP